MPQHASHVDVEPGSGCLSAPAFQIANVSVEKMGAVPVTGAGAIAPLL